MSKTCSRHKRLKKSLKDPRLGLLAFPKPIKTQVVTDLSKDINDELFNLTPDDIISSVKDGTHSYRQRAYFLQIQNADGKWNWANCDANGIYSLTEQLKPDTINTYGPVCALGERLKHHLKMLGGLKPHEMKYRPIPIDMMNVIYGDTPIELAFVQPEPKEEHTDDPS